MDEASSKFVDQLAIEKIIREKLGTVHHTTNKPWETLCDPIFDLFGMSLKTPKQAPKNTQSPFTLDTPIKWSPHQENNTIHIRHYPSLKTSGVVLLVHGLFEDSRELYNFFIGELNRLGLDVYLTTLPFHYERAPKESRFSGEYFLSGNLGRTKQAFLQAVIETRHVNNWLSRTTGLPVYVVGFSMGGTVVLAATGTSNDIEGAVVVNPASNLFEVVWTSPLCVTIKTDLLNAGLGAMETRTILSSFDPYFIPRLETGLEHQLFIYGSFDQMTRPDQYESLIETWGFEHVLRYKAGHLNTLRVPRFAADVARFFQTIERGESALVFPQGVA